MNETLNAQIRSVLHVVNQTVDYVESQKYYPRGSVYSDRVALALLGKSLGLCRSICLLVQEDLPEEAFGLSRTLLDIAFTLRFVANQDTEDRASRYINYFSKDRVHWAHTVLPKYYPGVPPELPADFDEAIETAKDYDSVHDWTGLKGKTRALALEEDSREAGFTAQFDYEVIYKWTSHYVHASRFPYGRLFIRNGKGVHVPTSENFSESILWLGSFQRHLVLK